MWAGKVSGKKSTTMSLVKLDFIDRVAFIEMQHTKRLNCLSKDLCDDVAAAIKTAGSCDDCVAIVIKAPDDAKVFSAGHDINELPKGTRDPLCFNTPMERLFQTVENSPLPVIAYVTGSVWGGGCDLCVTCDMIVASDDSTFAITPAKLGIPYNISGVMRFISALGINKAREMFFTAAPITAAEAYNLRLVNHFAPRTELKKILNERILDNIRKNSILSVVCLKRQFRVLSMSNAKISPEIYEALESLRTVIYNGADYLEGIHSFFEKRTPKFTGKVTDVNRSLF